MEVMKFDKEPIVKLQVEYVKSKGFFKTNREDNFYDELKYYYLNTSTHSAMVNNYSRLLFGNGVTANNEIDQFKIKEMKLNDVFINFFFDYSLYGCGAFIVKYNIEHTAILGIEYIDPTKLRIAYIDPFNYQLKTMFYKADWSNYRHENNMKNAIQLQVFGGDGTENTQVVYFHTTPLSLSYYPLPQYIGALKSIKTEQNILSYYENLSSNGFMGNILINFNDGDTADEVKVETAKELKKFLGPNSDSLAMVQWNSSAANAATVEKFNTESEDQKFLNLIQEYKANIITSHGASPALAGLETPGKLGDRNSIIEQYEKYMNEHVYTIRARFLEIFDSINKQLITPLSEYHFEDMTLFKEPQAINQNEFVVRYKKSTNDNE